MEAFGILVLPRALLRALHLLLELLSDTFRLLLAPYAEYGDELFRRFT